MSLKKIKLTIISLILITSISLRAQIYVSPLGSDSTGTGSIELPFKTIPKAITVTVAGDTIYLRGGTHSYSAKISLSNNGALDSMYSLFAYPDEKPIIDFAAIGGTSIDGFSLNGSYWHLKGIEIQKAPHNGIKISSGHHNIVENCSFHDCGNTGFQLGSNSTSPPYPSDNLILNCDAYYNFDSPVGGNADGFGIKWRVGSGNVFKGCRAYNNSDDGFDLWMCLGSITMDSCWAFRNGVDIWHTGSVNGNGNGFKLGGNNVATPNTVRNCLAFDNFSKGSGGKGFDENNNLAGQTLYNCTSYRNTFPNFSFPNPTLISGNHIIKNCISFEGLMPDTIVNAVQDHNSWNGLTVSNSDFITLDTSQAVALRNSDGTLPTITFLHLAGGSPLIDAGTDIGLPFNGLAPDLGAFEALSPNDVRENQGTPNGFCLYQNYPNPFNPSTKFYVGVPNYSHIIVDVFDILGRKVRTLIDQMVEPGYYPFEWNSETDNSGIVGSGIYFIRLKSGNFNAVQKVILSK
jgi:hypothetical protein